MPSETFIPSSRSKWATLGGLCLVCIVLARLCDAYIDTHESAKYIYLLIYFFHMPALMLLAGMMSRDKIRERRYTIVVSAFLFCVLTKILIFMIASLVRKNVSFSLINDSGISSYVMALGFCMLITFFTQRFDPRGVLVCSIVLACFAGYDKSLGDTLALSRTVVLYPFFFAGFALDQQKLSKPLSKQAVKIVAALILLLFVLSVYRYGAKLYWLRPLLTGRNSFDSLPKNAGYGWLLRLFYYPFAFCLILSLLSVIPERGLPVLNRIGSNTLSVFALSYTVFYILMYGIRLHGLIGKLNGIPLYLVLLLLSFLIAWLCARPTLERAVRWLITPDAWRKAEKQTRTFSFARFWKPGKRFSLVLLAATLFLTFTVVLYGPLSLFLGNAEDFWFSIKDVYHVVIPLFVVLSVALVLIGCVLPEKARRIYIKLLFGVALALYVQGTYINIDYGVLDGREIDWSQYNGYALWSSAVWVACIALPFILDLIPPVKKHMERILTVAAAFLLVIQVPAMVVDLINYKPKQGGEITVTTNGMYELSKKENIIMILFDTMDDEYFESFIGTHPDYVENLDGFVHYDNMLASGARTIEAVPSMLTGVPFIRQTTYSSYIESVWTDDTPLAAMDEAGYDVRCYTNSMYFGPEAGTYIHNIISSRQKVGSFATLGKKLYKLTSFRFAPHLLKQRFWMDTAEFNDAIAQKAENATGNTYVVNDAAFFRNYLSNGGFKLSNNYDKAFRFYLLEGVHSPYKLTSDGLDNSKKTSFKETMEGNFALLEAVLKDLKEKGIYDSSTIIVTADHGDRDRAQHPMFLYKAKGASGKLTISSVPASLFDLYTFFYQAAGTTSPQNKYSMDFLSLQEGNTRERHFFHNTSNNASRVVINEYVTTSPAKEYDKLVLLYEHQGENKNTPYVLGEELSFAVDATANRYCTDGFGNTTGWRTYLQGPYAHMEIPIKDLPSSGMLEVDIGVYKSTYKDTNVRVYANGVAVLEKGMNAKTVGKGLKFTLDIAEIFKAGDNHLNLEFYFDAISMDEMEKPVRDRTKSVSFTSFVIRNIA